MLEVLNLLCDQEALNQETIFTSQYIAADHNSFLFEELMSS